MSNIKEGCYSLRMAAIVGNSVIVVVRSRPQAIPLAMISMRKSIHGFLFLSYMSMGLCSVALCAAGAPLTFFQLVFTDGQISLNLLEKLSSRRTDQVGKIILTTGPFVQCLTLNETCGYVDESVQNVDHENDVTAVMLGLQKALVYHVQYLSIFGCMCHCRGVKNMRTCKSCAFLSALELDR